MAEEHDVVQSAPTCSLGQAQQLQMLQSSVVQTPAFIQLRTADHLQTVPHDNYMGKARLTLPKWARVSAK